MAENFFTRYKTNRIFSEAPRRADSPPPKNYAADPLQCRRFTHLEVGAHVLIYICNKSGTPRSF